jgi:hypothetical protein
MNMKWQMYQELELIPESVSHPKPSLLAWLTAPFRRPFADIFTRELSHKHQILLLKRCLTLTEGAQPKSTRSDRPKAADLRQQKEESSTPPQVLTQQQQMMAQQWISRGGVPWWTWYDS